MYKGACCSGNQAAKLQGLLLQLTAPKAPRFSRLGWESKPLEPLSLLRKEHTSRVQGSFFLSLSLSLCLSLFKRINCHLPTQTGCLLGWPQSSHPQTHYPAASCPDQPWEPARRGGGGGSGSHICVGLPTPTLLDPRCPRGSEKSVSWCPGWWPLGELIHFHPLWFLLPPWSKCPTASPSSFPASPGSDEQTGGPVSVGS